MRSSRSMVVENASPSFLTSLSPANSRFSSSRYSSALPTGAYLVSALRLGLGLRLSGALGPTRRRERVRDHGKRLRLAILRLCHRLDVDHLLARGDLDDPNALRVAARLADLLHEGPDDLAAVGDDHDLIVGPHHAE